MRNKPATAPRSLWAMLILMTWVAAGGVSTPANATTRVGVTSIAPSIASLSPTSVAAGSQNFTLTVSGTNFTNASTVYFGTARLVTTFGSSTSLTASVSAAAVAKAGKVNVIVANGGEHGYSLPAVFTVTTPTIPKPAITSLSPATCAAGNSGFTLTVTGTGFVAGSHVYFGTTSLATTFGSSTSLTAAVPSASVSKAGTMNVLVANGGDHGYSQPVAFTITENKPPRPTIASMSPTGCAAGSPDFILTVSGTGYVATSQVYFGHALLTTTVVSATQLTATVPAAAVAKAGKLSVAVTNGGDRGNSEPVTFSVTGTTVPHPAITSLNPATAVAGGADFALTVNGTGFVTGAKVYFGSQVLVTSFVSATQLTAAVKAANIALPGEVQVRVSNVAGATSGDGVSQPSLFPVTPQPANVFYSLGKPSGSGNDGVTAYYRTLPGKALDMTMPVSLTLTIPATIDESGNAVGAVSVFQTGSVTLGAGTPVTGGDLKGTAYQYLGAGLTVTVIAANDGHYLMGVSATGRDLSSVDTTKPVAVAMTIGGVTFQAQARPIVRLAK